MKSMLFKKLIFLAPLLVFSEVASADVTGLGDVAILASLAEQLSVLQSQYETLQNHYNNAVSLLENARGQLDNLKRLTEFNSGNYGYGNLENGLDVLKNWQSSANSWSDALKNIAGGNPSRYKELVKAYEKSHPSMMDTDFAKGASPTRLDQYKQNTAFNKTVSVETTYAFNDINEHMKKIHKLSLSIDKAPNTKAAMDLNSRLVAEVAYLSTKNLKLQTLISQQLAQAGANDLLEEAEAARFNRLPGK